METMNPNGFEKGPNDTDNAKYAARLKAAAEKLNGDFTTSQEKVKYWKRATIFASVAAFCLFVLVVILLWTNLCDRQEVKVAHKVEIDKVELEKKILKDENDQLKLAQKAPVPATAEDLKKAISENCVGKPAQKTSSKKGANVAGSRKPAPSQKEAVLPPPPVGGTFWGWVHPEATAANKRGCYADRLISGMPAQCSAIQVEPRAGAESEKQWNARVAAKNGIAVGVKDAKGTISGTTFERIQVK